jgi:hypothetical protein
MHRKLLGTISVGFDVTGQLLIICYANILGGSIHTIRKNTEAIGMADKEIGLEENAEKTKYMVMS